MTAHATTLPRPQLVPFDRAAYIATATFDPSITIIDRDDYLGILLARQTAGGEDDVVLRAVRWVRIPQGWRLRWLRLRSILRPARLPDEWLFNEIALQRRGRLYRAYIAPEGPVLPTPALARYPRKPFTDDEHARLEAAPGRELHEAVLRLFPQLSETRVMRTPFSPWPVFSG